MTPHAKRLKRVLSGLVRPKIGDKYAVMATIHQWHYGYPEFGVDMSDCIPVLEAAMKANGPMIRALVEEWQQDVKADCAAETN